MEQKMSPAQRYAFYRYEHGNWQTAVAIRSMITIPLIAFTLMSAYKKQPIKAPLGACASCVGLKCIQKANFYRKRAYAREKLQKNSMIIR